MTRRLNFESGSLRRSCLAAGSHAALLVLGALVLQHCGLSSQESAHAQTEALSGFAPGVYSIVDSRSFALDGGFYHWSGLTEEEVYTLNNGPDQQWRFVASRSGFTICNVGVANACLSDAGGTLAIGVGQDVWTVTSSGSGYSLQSQKTSDFATDPASPADKAVVPISSTATAWTLNAVGSGSSVQPGNYYIEDSASFAFAIDGGFFYWSGLTVAELYSLNYGQDQQWRFATSGSGFTLCNVGVPNACLSDGGSTLDIGVGIDVWTVKSSRSGYSIQSQTTGRFIANPAAPADTVGVPVASSASSWTLAAAFAACTPSCSGLQCGDDGCGGSCGACGGGQTCSNGECVGGGGSWVTVNQDDPCAVYSIGNGGVSSAPPDYDWDVGHGSLFLNGDEYFTNFPNAAVSVTFNGTGIVWTGETGPNFGISSYSIDGASPSTFDGYSVSNTNQANVTLSGLAPGSHVLQLQTTGTKNGASSNYYLTTDSFTIAGSPLPSSSGTVAGYDRVTVSGSGWTCGGPNFSDLSGGHCWSGNAGDSISWNFTGSLIEMYGRPDLGDGYFNVIIDGSQVATVDGWLPSITADNDGLTAYMEFAAKLSSGNHTIQLVVTGTHNPGAPGENSGANNLLQFDQFIAFR